MNTILWVLQGVLAFEFIAPGIKKIQLGQKKVIPFKMMLLGWAEILGVVGIIVPYLTGIAPILTPITAVCFSIVLIGAIPLHYKRKEVNMALLLVALLAISVLVAYYRFPS